MFPKHKDHLLSYQFNVYRCHLSSTENLNPMLTKILIKESENFTQLADCGTDYIGEGLHYPVYGGKQFPVQRYGYEVLRRKNSQIL